MSKLNKIVLFIFLLLAAFLTCLEAIEPEPVNWNPSYSATDKIPLGTYILFDNLTKHFEKGESITIPAFEFLTQESPKGTYVFINTVVHFDDSELEKMLKWVKKGNNLFISTDAFSKNLLDSLGLNVSTLVPGTNLSSKPMVNLVQPDFRSEKAYLFDKEVYHSVFSELDTLNHTVLGVSQLYTDTRTIENPEVNFVKVPYGEGEIFLHTTPQAFSNYFILTENNSEYVEKAMAYLPTDGHFYWDEYQKAGKEFQTSFLYILMENKALKWAYYLLIIGAILFILFEGKRKQRSIPVVNPLKNQTYNFTRTIAGLYLERKDYKSIAGKKISHFLDYIRTQYRIPTGTIDKAFFDQVAVQSESSPEEVRALFQLMNTLEARNTITKEELQKLNASIDSIKKKD